MVLPAVGNGRCLELQERLTRAIREAIPAAVKAERAETRADSTYRAIADVLVALRHEFKASDTGAPDLRGRSVGYRMVVRESYAAAGVEVDGPIGKRVTVGVAYWVRKLLLEQYGERALSEMGVLRPYSFASVTPHSFFDTPVYDDPDETFSNVVGVLNRLAIDPNFIPSEDAVRSVLRAVAILESKLATARSQARVGVA